MPTILGVGREVVAEANHNSEQLLRFIFTTEEGFFLTLIVLLAVGIWFVYSARGEGKRKRTKGGV